MTDSHLAPLRRPLDALAARVALIDEAGTSLDLQYYEWDSDTVGYLLLDRLLAAGDRGVAVRLLIDDLRFRKRTHWAASLALHPRIEVRLFNPWQRGSNIVKDAIAFARQFAKLDRRMHNKLLVADGAQAIVGGRNIADAHYGLARAYNLVDYDILLSGAGVSDLEAVFETYWDSPPAIPAQRLARDVVPSDLETVRTRIRDQVAVRSAALPADLATATAWRDRAAARLIPIPDDAVGVTSDTPGRTTEIRPTQVIAALRTAVADAREEIVVVTPFFVPNEMDIGFYAQLADRGVRTRLLTNSLASNMGTISNSGLNPVRKEVVNAGIELYELRADAAAKPRWVIAPNAGGYLGLHAKLYTIDRKRVFLGSVNLDPRSKFINTETGLLIESAEFAGDTAANIEALMTPDNAWRVGLDRDGRLTWTSTAGKTHRQPARSRGQRFADRAFQILPIKRYI